MPLQHRPNPLGLHGIGSHGGRAVKAWPGKSGGTKPHERANDPMKRLPGACGPLCNKEQAMNRIVVDISSHVADAAIKQLSAMEEVVEVENCGKYRQDENWTKLIVETELTEDEVDDWLYNADLGKHFEYGTAEIK